ncbi:agmatine deiminase family protein [Crocosphaera sp. XPORK-15E]|uniref:agmatine deiminase family protein n=1 Tax=Crocosphaera sp. XPORK-15E TaxID=3110247 RepID=UPI002B1F0854|nr:agmatine deiminase family protein [Crocosphaera sp. XPORK-15E]MEA5535317.1 agmatine deiminase family protein [Crocosphaera sp. XPORK-15E]
MYLLPAEWYEQDGVMLSWPHQDTDWSVILDEIHSIYLNLCREITKRQKLLLVVRDQDLKSTVINLLVSHNIDLGQVQFVIALNNDIWVRDYGPITLVNQQGKLKILDFVFNGWGKKYEGTGYQSFLDDKINGQVISQSANPEAKTESISFVLEGGAIESDGQGTLLTTKACLLNPNRNPQWEQQQIEDFLLEKLGLTTILWLQHGHLEGDDTDSHIDTLVRFAPHNTLVYVACDDRTDSHYPDLNSLETELKALKTSEGKAYRLIALPWPKPKYNHEGDRLPASYANYLIINGAVLVPTYRDQADEKALMQIEKAYPDHEIIGIDCLPLIHQFGSLHCMSMQLPKGFLKP